MQKKRKSLVKACPSCDRYKWIPEGGTTCGPCRRGTRRVRGKAVVSFDELMQKMQEFEVNHPGNMATCHNIPKPLPVPIFQSSNKNQKLVNRLHGYLDG